MSHLKRNNDDNGDDTRIKQTLHIKSRQNQIHQRQVEKKNGKTCAYEEEEEANVVLAHKIGSKVDGMH